MMRPGRACVIGGQGTLGQAVVASLRSSGWSVQAVGRRHDADLHIDLDRPGTLPPVLTDVDLIVSAVPDPAFAAERWVLENGGLLVNCSHAAGAEAAALTAKTDGRCRGTVLLNAGLVPGIANTVAAELLDKHSSADTLEVAFTVVRQATAGRGGGEFVHSGLASSSRHEVVDLPLPEPFGRLACIEVHEDEDCGFAGVAAGRRVKNYLGFGDRSIAWSLRVVNALRLMRTLPKAAFTPNGAHKGHPSQEPTGIWVGASAAGELLGSRTIECDGDYRTTAEAARMFSEALIADRRPGCFNPEDLFNLGDLMAPLNEIGVRIGNPDR
jgi:NAD(P)-dependent dehydrogenase (short-subunit alcohol dehydrogenase family)